MRRQLVNVPEHVGQRVLQVVHSGRHQLTRLKDYLTLTDSEKTHFASRMVDRMLRAF